MDRIHALTTQSAPWNETQAEQSIAAVTEMMREMSWLLRAMAPMVSELRALQELARQWKDLDLTQFDDLFKAGASSTLTRGEASGAAHPAADRAAPPAPPRTEQPSPRTVYLSIARIDGPIEPARISRGLALLAGVESVALVRQERGRLTVALDVDRPPREIPLTDALATVFAEQVHGEWSSPTEFVAIVPDASKPARDT